MRLSPCGRGYKIEGLGERKPPKLQIFPLRGSVMVAGSHLPLGGGESDFDELGERKPPKHLKSQVRGSVIPCPQHGSPHQENLKFRRLALA